MKSNGFYIRPIKQEDDKSVAALIRDVMPEFGASGEGFAIHDTEVDLMFETYTKPHSIYFVVCEVQGEIEKVVGGGGIAPLEGGDESVCELRKMYFQKTLRGKGFGQRLINKCLVAAKEFGFKSCYLETLKTMTQAQSLYVKNGFEPVSKPMGKTGHFGCDAWYIKSLE